MSPRVLPSVQGPYRFFFFSNEGSEPPHVHVRREINLAKFWLDPVRLERSRGFTRKEIGTLQALVEENRQQLLDSWHEYFHG